MANIDIRLRAKGKGVPMWKVADALGVSEPTLYRKLRHELSYDEKMVLFDMIERLAEKQ